MLITKIVNMIHLIQYMLNISIFKELFIKHAVICSINEHV